MDIQLNQMIEVYCVNTESKILVPRGSDLKGVMQLAGIENPKKILGAYVNNRVRNLNFRIYSPRLVTFIDIFNSNARRMYSLSLMFMCYKAVKDLYPQGDINILHSMNDGYYCELVNCPDDNAAAINKIKKYMQDLVKRDIPFGRNIMLSSEAKDLFNRVGLTEKAKLIEHIGKIYTNVDILDDTVNAFFFELVPSTGYLDIFDVQEFEKGIMLFMPDNDKDYKEPGVITNQKKLFAIFQEHKNWVDVLGTPYVTDLNEAIQKYGSNLIIQISEALHEKKYAQIADAIYKKKDNIKFVFLAGPSSSGKTTSCKRIATQLAVLGIRPLTISMDDYFNNREHTPKDKDGNYDFECLEALDLDFFNLQMEELLQGEEIELPRFDFLKGEKAPSGKKIHLTDNSIVIIEGIHALNPVVSKKIARKNKYFVFVSALTQIALDRHNLISTSSNRLIRRIVRDHNYRGSSAEATLLRWPSVRAGEEKHIFPYQENADSTFNSSLLYEIGVLKHYCEPLLMDVPQNSPAYADARSLNQFLQNFVEIEDKFIPPTSIMREFLGGSSFSY